MGKKCQMGQLGLGDRWLDLRKKKEDGKILNREITCSWVGISVAMFRMRMEANTEENRLGDCGIVEENRLGDCGIVAIPCGTGMVPHICSKIYLLSLGVSHSHYWMIYPTCVEGFCFCFFNQFSSFAVEIVSLLLQNFTSSQYVILFY